MKVFLFLALFFQLSCSTTRLAVDRDADPNIWLEEVEGKKALDWVVAQNNKSLAELQGNPRYKQIESELRKNILAEDRIPDPGLFDGQIYNFWQDKKHVRGIWRQTSKTEYARAKPQWVTIIDVDKLAIDEKENWVWHGADCSRETKTCLVSLSRGGKDADVVREFDLAKREFVKGGFVSPEAKQMVSWFDKETVIIGTDFGKGSLTLSGYPRILKVWKRQTDLSQAKVIFEGQPNDVWVYAMQIERPEGKEVFIGRGKTFYEKELYYVRPNLQIEKIEIPLKHKFRGLYKNFVLIEMDAPWLVGKESYKTGDLVAVDFKSNLKQPRTALAFRPLERQALSRVAISKNRTILSILDNVKGKILDLQNVDGTWKTREIPFEQKGTIGIATADPFEDRIYVMFESHLSPDTLYLFKGTSDRYVKVKSLPARFNAKNIAVDQFEVKSRDGTIIPYFVMRPKNLKFDGTAPTILYGYGGFQIPQLPVYMPNPGKVWVEKGNVWVDANIRGGGEFGPSWHEAALKENRQKAFDDFIAVAEDLIARKITSPRRLGIQGGSNGGLLVGATFTQRPDLLNAVVCEVPLLDMLRFHKLLAGHSWTAEYGNPDDPKMREVLAKYSPYQNVFADKKYPNVLFITSTKDDRVHPGHARKMAAKMMSQGHGVMYYENIEGGHGAAANLEQRIRMRALEFSYLYKQLVD